MALKTEKITTWRKIRDYFAHLPDQSPYWRRQATAWGVALVAAIAMVGTFAIMTFSSIYGGGNVSYAGVGSPGPVVFSHQRHMWFADGKYKECKSCHDSIFAAQKYGTYVLSALKDSPERKIRIGRDSSTLCVLGSGSDEASLVTYQTPRACATCATGNCHDGKESFSRMECLSCHRAR